MGKSKFDSENQTLTLPTMRFFSLGIKPQPSTAPLATGQDILPPDHEPEITSICYWKTWRWPTLGSLKRPSSLEAQVPGKSEGSRTERSRGKSSGRSGASLRQMHSQGLGCRQGEGPSLSCTAGNSCKAHLQSPAGQLRTKPCDPRA